MEALNGDVSRLAERERNLVVQRHHTAQTLEKVISVTERESTKLQESVEAIGKSLLSKFRDGSIGPYKALEMHGQLHGMGMGVMAQQGSVYEAQDKILAPMNQQIDQVRQQAFPLQEQLWDAQKVLEVRERQLQEVQQLMDDVKSGKRSLPTSAGQMRASDPVSLPPARSYTRRGRFTSPAGGWTTFSS